MPSTSSAFFSTMSLARLFPPPPQTTLLGPSSSHILSNLPLQVHHRHIKLSLSPHPWGNNVAPCQCSCSSSPSDSSPLIAEEEDGELEVEEIELRECVSEILVEARVSKSDSLLIASNSPKYAKMLRESVRDLDELSLWHSWMKENDKGKEKGEKMTHMSFKEKVKHIAMEKGDNGKIPFLESVGLSLPSSIHLARFLVL